MAINIFQSGNKYPSNKPKVNSAKNSVRAEASLNALAAPGQTSDSGSTAVKQQGVLGKVGNFIGKTAGIASKLLPGLGGTIAGMLANSLNDPEWWQSVPGDALTTNNPLRMLEVESYGTSDNRPMYAMRSAIAEFVSVDTPQSSLPETSYVMIPTDQQVTQYLMPAIRKVVNAVPLQDAHAYATALAANATLYALWRQLRKLDYLLKHGMAFMPNLNSNLYPIFQVENAAWLQTTVNRLEEYLRSNVRLPHTMCEYLAWRYGRTYRAHNSAKSGLIMYNVRTLTTPIDTYNEFIQSLMNRVASDTSVQKANTDIYNAYYDHDLLVEISDATQCTFDPKEWALRTNCDIRNTTDTEDYDDIVYLDSSLDNPTAFMASTVSTLYRDPVTNDVTVLFPVRELYIYTKVHSVDQAGFGIKFGTDASSYTLPSTDGWLRERISPFRSWDYADPGAIGKLLYQVAIMKAMDIYNKNVGITAILGGGAGNTRCYVDLTAPSVDSGMVKPITLQTEQVYAFANLCAIERKHSLSYSKAEKLVAKDVANFTESIDMATAASPA